MLWELGLPHYGHLLASTIKDAVPRYWSMKGRYVERRFGWDTHGVPIEFEIDKKLGISGKAAVQEFGIDKYNEECRSIVLRFAQEWRQTIERLGRWIDFDNDYKVRGPTRDTLKKRRLRVPWCRRWIQNSWNLCGGFSSSFMRRMLSTEDTASCHTPLL